MLTLHNSTGLLWARALWSELNERELLDSALLFPYMDEEEGSSEEHFSENESAKQTNAKGLSAES